VLKEKYFAKWGEYIQFDPQSGTASTSFVWLTFAEEGLDWDKVFGARLEVHKAQPFQVLGTYPHNYVTFLNKNNIYSWKDTSTVDTQQEKAVSYGIHFPSLVRNYLKFRAHQNLGSHSRSLVGKILLRGQHLKTRPRTNRLVYSGLL
jgi:hypothetical protein